MRQLHVVAVSEDGRHVVLATSKGASRGDFRVPLDDRLAAAVRGDLPRPGEAAPAGVTPKEIQARLRAGESTEQIAASAGVPVARIDRYAGPVLSERERVLDQARAGFVSRSRLGPSALPLGEAVDRHLAETTGVRPETVGWSTRREESGSWLVELSYVSQARRRSAAWRYDVHTREVTPTDNNSAVLAHVEPSRRSKVHSEPMAVAPAPAKARAASRSRKVAAARPASTASRTIAARPSPGVAAARKSATGKAAAAAQDERRAAQAAAAARAAEQAQAAQVAKAAKAAQAAKAAKAAKAAQAAQAVKAAQAAQAAQAAAEQPPGPPTLRVVGGADADPPVRPRRAPKEPPAAARTAPARAAGQRASVPGWADVLLSTAPVARPGDADAETD